MDFQCRRMGNTITSWIIKILWRSSVYWDLSETKRASKVVNELYYIFSLWGAPRYLQSDNGRELVNEILSTMLQSWPGCTQIHGQPRYPQSQGSAERANATVEDMINSVLAKWKNHKWSKALSVVVFAKNTQIHKTIGRSFYVAFLGHPPPVQYHLRDDPEGEAGKCVVWTQYQ